MRRVGFVCLLVIGACKKTTVAPQTADVGPIASVAPPPVEVAPAPPPHVATIALVEKDHDLRSSDFDVRGLPAVDPDTDAIVIADVSHGYIASSLSLTVRWMVPGKKEPLRRLVILDEREAGHITTDIDYRDVPRETDKLFVKVRARIDEANALFAKNHLRPTVACTIQSPDSGVGCVHPQKLTCGTRTFELRGDELSGTKLGWKVAPMDIGAGPPKEMVTCIHEAHLDETRMRLAARTETSCKGGGSDACYLPDEWRVATIR